MPEERGWSARRKRQECQEKEAGVPGERGRSDGRRRQVRRTSQGPGERVRGQEKEAGVTGGGRSDKRRQE